jgi:Tc5 transposase DNA-binding domain/helix-turn-helix, Psq domain
MLFAELHSILYQVMAEEFANLSKRERVEKAVAKCLRDSSLSARKAAQIYNIAHTTITRRSHEQSRPKKLIDQSKQLLTPVEERTLVRWVIQYYKWGLPLAFKQIRQFALEIVAKKTPVHETRPSLSDRWHRKLLQRHPEIKRVSARGLDRVRASAAHIETIQEYFELYRSVQQSHRITSQDTYNIDEKGFCIGAI